jgi:hypothetical protein
LRVFVAPRDSRHTDEGVVQFLGEGSVLECALDERVLDDLVLDASLSKLRAELRDVFDGHPLEVEEDRRRHLVEAGFDEVDLRIFCRSFHVLPIPPRPRS